MKLYAWIKRWVQEEKRRLIMLVVISGGGTMFLLGIASFEKEMKSVKTSE